jgi:hypothetical protein
MGHTVASREILVVLDEPVEVLLPGPREMLALQVRIRDGFASVEWNGLREMTRTRPGRRVMLDGWWRLKSGAKGKREGFAWYDPDDPASHDGAMPEWLSLLVEEVAPERELVVG